MLIKLIPPAPKRSAFWRPEIVATILVYIGFASVFSISTAQDIADDPIGFKFIRIVTTILMFAVCATTVLRRNLLRHLSLPSVWPFCLFIVTCCLSIPYSLNISLSLFKSFELFGILLLIIVMIGSSNARPIDFLNLNVTIILFILCVVLIEAALWPGRAFTPLRGATPLLHNMMSGVYPALNPNTVGMLGGILASTMFPRILMSRPARQLSGAYSFHKAAGVLLIGVLVTFLAYSRSAIMGVGASFAIILFINIRLRRGIRATLYLVFGLFILILFVLKPIFGDVETWTTSYLKRGQNVENVDEIYSGRKEIWTEVWKKYEGSVFGEGYAAGFRYADIKDWGQAHNSIFELLANVGWLGTLAWLLLIVRFLVRFARLQSHLPSANREESLQVLGVTIFLLVKTYATCALVYPGYDLLIFSSLIVYVEKMTLLTSSSSGAGQNRMILARRPNKIRNVIFQDPQM